MQIIPSGSTTSHIHFVMTLDGTPVAGATITGVSYKKGTGSYTAMTSPTTGHDGAGLHHLVADEDTTITSGLVYETITFVITASDADTAFVGAVIMDSQATLSDIGDEIVGRSLTLASDQSAVTNLGGIDVSGSSIPANGNWIQEETPYTVSSENDPTANVQFTPE